MNKKDTILLGAACFFSGMVAGFFIAPIKKGIYCGNNSGNNVAAKEDLEKICDKTVEEKFAEE